MIIVSIVSDSNPEHNLTHERLFSNNEKQLALEHANECKLALEEIGYAVKHLPHTYAIREYSCYAPERRVGPPMEDVYPESVLYLKVWRSS